MKLLKAKFEIQDMLPIAITLAVVGIGAAFGLGVIVDVKDDFCTHGASASGNQCLNSTGGTEGTHTETLEFNASLNAATGVSKLPAKVPLIATVIVAAIVIGILVRYLFIQGKQ